MLYKKKDKRDIFLHFCLLIPCYNNFEGLIKSITSVSYYNHQYLILIVDDGSELLIDNKAVEQNVGNRPIQILRLPTNKGITAALNAGIEWILENVSTKYIARLDCGDLCHHQRFFKQVKYLDTHLDVGLISSWCIFQKSDASLSYTYKTPTAHKDILKVLYFRNVFIHPTVMFRTSLVQIIGRYPNNFPYVEDYAFFWAIAKIAKTSILSEYLTICEINASGISITNRNLQLKGRYKVVSIFGKHKLMRLIGQIKIILLLLIPYKFTLYLKRFV